MDVSKRFVFRIIIIRDASGTGKTSALGCQTVPFWYCVCPNFVQFVYNKIKYWLYWNWWYAGPELVAIEVNTTIDAIASALTCCLSLSLQVFHCVHFEAPAEPNAPVDQGQRSHDDAQSAPSTDGAVAADNQHLAPIALARSDSPIDEMDGEGDAQGAVAMAIDPMLHQQGPDPANDEARHSPEVSDDGYGGAAGGHDDSQWWTRHLFILSAFLWDNLWNIYMRYYAKLCQISVPIFVMQLEESNWSKRGQNMSAKNAECADNLVWFLPFQ